MRTSRVCAIRGAPGQDLATGVHGPGAPNWTCQPIPAPSAVGICRFGIPWVSHSQPTSRINALSWTGVHGRISRPSSVSMDTAKLLAFLFASARIRVSMYCSMTPSSVT